MFRKMKKNQFDAVHAMERSNVKKQRALVWTCVVVCPAEQANNVDHNSLQKNRVCMHLGAVHFRQATRRDLLRFQEWPARFRRLPAFQTRSSGDRVTERRQHPVKILATKLLVPSNYQLPRSAPRYLSVADTPPNVGNGEAPAWSVKPPGRAPSCAPSSDIPKRQIDMTERRRGCVQRTTHTSMRNKKNPGKHGERETVATRKTTMISQLRSWQYD